MIIIISGCLFLSNNKNDRFINTPSFRISTRLYIVLGMYIKMYEYILFFERRTKKYQDFRNNLYNLFILLICTELMGHSGFELFPIFFYFYTFFTFSPLFLQFPWSNEVFICRVCFFNFNSCFVRRLMILLIMNEH